MLENSSPDVLGDALGFGIGWYALDAAPAVYSSAVPGKLNVNLPHLGRSVSSGLWLLHKHTTDGEAILEYPRQPLCDDSFLFAQQGGLEGFRTQLCPVIRQFLAPEIEGGIRGNSTAEYLFAVLRHLLADDEEMSLDQALVEMFKLLDDWLEESSAQLNVLISDGEGWYAARHAINAACAPLYFTTDDEAYPDAELIASEPLTDSEFWQPVPEHHVLILDPYEPPELIAL
jgi:glutamine amidotransferase